MHRLQMRTGSRGGSMTQGMKRWMLAAVITAAMVVASAGMGAAATIALDDDGADVDLLVIYYQIVVKFT